MKRVKKLSIGGVTYNVLGYVTGESYDGKLGFSYYVCENETGEFVLVPFDASFNSYNCVLSRRDASVTVKEFEKIAG